MWSEAEVRSALMAWTAAQEAVTTAFKSESDYDYQRGLAAGYVGALEMVLRPEPTDSGAS